MCSRLRHPPREERVLLLERYFEALHVGRTTNMRFHVRLPDSTVVANRFPKTYPMPLGERLLDERCAQQQKVGNDLAWREHILDIAARFCTARDKVSGVVECLDHAAGQAFDVLLLKIERIRTARLRQSTHSR